MQITYFRQIQLNNTYYFLDRVHLPEAGYEVEGNKDWSTLEIIIEP